MAEVEARLRELGLPFEIGYYPSRQSYMVWINEKGEREWKGNHKDKRRAMALAVYAMRRERKV